MRSHKKEGELLLGKAFSGLFLIKGSNRTENTYASFCSRMIAEEVASDQFEDFVKQKESICAIRSKGYFFKT